MLPNNQEDKNINTNINTNPNTNPTTPNPNSNTPLTPFKETVDTQLAALQLTCEWCTNGRFDEIDYVESLLSEEAKKTARLLGIKFRDRYDQPECPNCARQKNEFKDDLKAKSTKSTLSSAISDFAKHEEDRKVGVVIMNDERVIERLNENLVEMKKMKKANGENVSAKEKELTSVSLNNGIYKRRVITGHNPNLNQSKDSLKDESVSMITNASDTTNDNIKTFNTGNDDVNIAGTIKDGELELVCEPKDQATTQNQKSGYLTPALQNEIKSVILKSPQLISRLDSPQSDHLDEILDEMCQIRVIKYDRNSNSYKVTQEDLCEYEVKEDNVRNGYAILKKVKTDSLIESPTESENLVLLIDRNVSRMQSMGSKEITGDAILGKLRRDQKVSRSVKGSTSNVNVCLDRNDIKIENDEVKTNQLQLKDEDARQRVEKKQEEMMNGFSEIIKQLKNSNIDKKEIKSIEMKFDKNKELYSTLLENNKLDLIEKDLDKTQIIIDKIKKQNTPYKSLTLLKSRLEESNKNLEKKIQPNTEPNTVPVSLPTQQQNNSLFNIFKSKFFLNKNTAKSADQINKSTPMINEDIKITNQNLPIKKQDKTELKELKAKSADKATFKPTSVKILNTTQSADSDSFILKVQMVETHDRSKIKPEDTDSFKNRKVSCKSSSSFNFTEVTPNTKANSTSPSTFTIPPLPSTSSSYTKSNTSEQEYIVPKCSPVYGLFKASATVKKPPSISATITPKEVEIKEKEMSLFPPSVRDRLLERNSQGIKINKINRINLTGQDFVTSKQILLDINSSEKESQMTSVSLDLTTNEKIKNIIYEANRRCLEKPLFTQSFYQTKAFAKRYVISRPRKTINIEEAESINDLKHDCLLLRINKKGKNGAWRKNWFCLNGHMFICYNSRPIRVSEASKPVEDSGDLFNPDDSTTFLTQKYAIDLKTCERFLLGKLESTSLMPRSMLGLSFFKPSPQDNFISLKDRTVQHAELRGEGFVICLQDSDEQTLTYIFDEIAVCVVSDERRFFYRFRDLTNFLRWNLAVELRQANGRTVE